MYYDPWQIAIHEAAHAIVAERMGLVVVEIMFCPEGIWADGIFKRGHCEVFSMHLPTKRARFALAVMAYAGPIAEAAVLDCEPESCVSYAGDDAMALRQAPGGSYALWKFQTLAKDRAERILDRPRVWGRIERLAERLMDWHA